MRRPRHLLLQTLAFAVVACGSSDDVSRTQRAPDAGGMVPGIGGGGVSGGSAMPSSGGNGAGASDIGSNGAGRANAASGGADASVVVDASADASDATVDVVDSRPASTPLPACTWPSDLLSPTADLDLPDGFGARCIAGRTFLICQGSNGGASCITNDPTRCPAFGFGISFPMVPSAAPVCRDQCAPSEYAAGCSGGLGPGVEQLPPPSLACREIMGGEGGPIYCCPCGS